MKYLYYLKLFFMKKLYATITLFLISFSFYGQIVNIPDANFKNKLLLATANTNIIARDIDGNYITIDSNSNGEIETTEALAVYYLDISNASINNLTGIESFTNLKGFDCSQNNLTDLPIANLVDLRGLYCETNQLNSIGALENLTLLTNLSFGNNPLTSVNLNQLSQLEKLEFSLTPLTEINLCGTAVTLLWCPSNPNLQSISVKNNTMTPSVTFRNADVNFPPPLTFFDFSNLPSLTNICYDEGELNAVLESQYTPTGVSLTTDCEANCLTLSAENPTAFAGISVYPNPATSRIAFESDVSILSIKLYNSLGQLLKTVSDSTLTSIDVSSLKAGTYFIEINSDQGKTTKKFVKI